MWTFGGAQKSGEKEDSILKMENRYGSGGIRESEIVWMRLYPNQ